MVKRIGVMNGEEDRTKSVAPRQVVKAFFMVLGFEGPWLKWPSDDAD